MSGASRLIPLPSCIMLLPAGAHFWRSGQPGLTAACLVLAALALITVALLVRAVANATGILTLQSVVENHPLQSMVFISVMVFNVLANFGMVVMVKESADARNETLALTDELTGLHNRRHIQHTLHQQLAQAQRSGQPLGLLLLDVDWFKRINDEHGHLSGDRVLRELAAHLQIGRAHV